MVSAAPSCDAELCQLLAAVGMAEYAKALAASGVYSLAELRQLDDKGLSAAGIGKTLHQRKLRRALAEQSDSAPRVDLAATRQPAAVAANLPSRGHRGEPRRRRVPGEAEPRAPQQHGDCAPPSERARYSDHPSVYPEAVSTPWVRDICTSQGISVGDEVLSFGVFLKPTSEEKSACKAFKLAVQLAAAKVCPGVKVWFVGSRGCDCALPSSAPDVVLENWQGGLGALGQLAAGLAATGHCVEEQCARGTYLRVRHRDSFGVERLSYVWLSAAEESPQRKLSQFLKKRLDANEGAGRSVCLLLRTLLAHSNLNGAAQGGLSGQAVAVMVAAAAERAEPQQAGPAEAAAQLLRCCLELYGKWDWARTPVAIGACPGAAACGAPSVLHPFDAAVNLAARCDREKQISGMLEYARLAIAEYEKKGPPLPGQLMTRAVTPLSAVIAHKGLWDRSHMLRRQQALRQQQQQQHMQMLPSPVIGPLHRPLGTSADSDETGNVATAVCMSPTEPLVVEVGSGSTQPRSLTAYLSCASERARSECGDEDEADWRTGVCSSRWVTFP